MSDFKVGDRVVCIDDSNTLFPFNLKKGKVYTVISLGHGTEIFIGVRGGSWKQERFRLATSLDEVLE